MPQPTYAPYATTPVAANPNTPKLSPINNLTQTDVKAKRLLEEEAQRTGKVAEQNYDWNTSTLNANKQYIADMAAKMGLGGGSSSSTSTSGTGAWTPADQAASAASFGRAKDRQAETIGASMGALKNAMSSRGLGGSGLERQTQAAIVGGGAANLGEFERARVLSEIQQRQAAAALAASSASSQRGQDYGFLSSLLGLMNAGVRY